MRTSEIDPGCPIPKAHRRLCQLHQLWHQAEHSYQDVNSFTISLNAFLECARSVTWVLQKEGANRDGFKSWYLGFQDQMRDDDLMRWSVEARNVVTKEGDLATESTASVSLLFTDDETTSEAFAVPPMLGPTSIAALIQIDGLSPRLRDQAVLGIERRWTVAGLDGRELLESLAHIYAFLAKVIRSAHAHFGADTILIEGDGHNDLAPIPVHPSGMFPCMLSVRAAQTAYWHVAEARFMDAAPLDSTLGQSTPEKLAEASARYRTVIGEPKPMPGDAHSRGRWFHDIARKMLKADGYHLMLAWLFRDGELVDQFDVTPESNQDKVVMARRIAQAANISAANEVILTGEMFVAAEVPAVDIRFPQRATERNDREECLSTSLVQRADEHRIWITPFSRDPSGTVILGDLQESALHEPALLRPVLELWSAWPS